jgi:hypothetical protein
MQVFVSGNRLGHQMEKVWFVIRDGKEINGGPFDLLKLEEMACNGQLKKSDGIRHMDSSFISAIDFWGVLTGTGTMDDCISLTDSSDESSMDDSPITLVLEDEDVELTDSINSLEPTNTKTSHKNQRNPVPAPSNKQTGKVRQNRSAPMGNKQEEALSKRNSKGTVWWNREIPTALGGILVVTMFYIGYRSIYGSIAILPKSYPTSMAAGSGGSFPEPKSSNAIQQLSDLRSKIEQWKDKKEKLQQHLRTLESDKVSTATSLKALGANPTDLKSSDPKAVILLVELRDILRQIVTFDKKKNEFDIAIFKSESKLRTTERRIAAQDLAGTDEELSALISSIVAMDQELDSETANEIPIEFDELISKALSDSAPSKTGVVEQQP